MSIEDHLPHRLHQMLEHAPQTFHDRLAQNASPYDKDTDSWPTTTGTVEWAEAQLVSAGQDAYWAGELTYSYSAEDDYFAGCYHIGAQSEAEADALVRGWKGKKVTVRYSPRDNKVCVMLPYEPPATGDKAV
jgi:hypothetical protein